MFGGIEQLPPKAKGTTAEGPSFLVKLIKSEFLSLLPSRIPSFSSFYLLLSRSFLAPLFLVVEIEQ